VKDRIKAEGDEDAAGNSAEECFMLRFNAGAGSLTRHGPRRSAIAFTGTLNYNNGD